MGLAIVRYGIGGVMVIAGVVMLIADRAASRSMASRSQRVAARGYLEDPGRWPDEAP